MVFCKPSLVKVHILLDQSQNRVNTVLVEGHKRTEGSLRLDTF